MTRQQKILELQSALKKALSERRRRRARDISARLSPMVTRQIRAELRQEAKS